jgi:hypothetical protein
LIMRLFFESCNLFALIYTQSFFTTSVRGNPLVPTIAPRSALGVSGFINAADGLRADFFLAAFFFGAAFLAAFFGAAFLAAFFGAAFLAAFFFVAIFLILEVNEYLVVTIYSTKYNLFPMVVQCILVKNIFLYPAM